MIKMLAINVLRAYRYAISPLFPACCRFYPSCSQYCLEAIERYGVWRGSALGFTRLLRCHPWTCGGHDPVP